MHANEVVYLTHRSTYPRPRKTNRFYSDIRLGNLVLDENNNLVIVDFEQRGVLTHCPAPEINYLDVILQLANSEDILPK